MTLEAELQALGEVPVPDALLAKTWLAILAEMQESENVSIFVPKEQTP